MLDAPGGVGWSGEELARASAVFIYGDINNEKSNFTDVDLEEPPPFDDCSFDAVVCCEGMSTFIRLAPTKRVQM